MLKARAMDGLQFLGCLTPRRIGNMAAIALSHYLSRFTRRPIHWGMPISLSIEPTTSCNLRCPECISGLRAFTRPTGMLDIRNFKRTIDEVSKWTPYLLLYFQGEPYLNKNFLKMAQYAAGKGMYVATSTNGHYLTPQAARETIESGLSRLIISVDGTSQQVYQQYRIGGQLDKVKRGIAEVVAWKKKLGSRTPHIILQFLIVRPNEHQVEEVKALALELGVDELKLKTAQVYTQQDANALIPLNPRYTRYRKGADGKYALDNPLNNRCWRTWQGAVLTWEGQVLPCCFDKDAEYSMGTITDALSFREIWKGQQAKAFRRGILTDRAAEEICRNCIEGSKVWI